MAGKRRVAILVPRRAGNADRDRLWAFCRARWEQMFPGWPIVEGHHDVGPFNRSAAVNLAAEQAGRWDVALIVDSDTISNPEAVKAAVDVAAGTGRLCIPHHERIMLNALATSKVLGGYTGPWRQRDMVENVYRDSVSCAVAVPRGLWDQLGGFDPLFVGWGQEDSAFAIAAETVAGPLVRLASECFHLWHTRPATETTWTPNRSRLALYEAARGDVTAMAALLDEAKAAPTAVIPDWPTTIPRRLFRTVPEQTTAQVEGWWELFGALHPGWELTTYREPLDPAEWPLTGDLWPRCQNGAQRAGLIRLEALARHGGVYVDSDVEPIRSLEPLLHCRAFAGWEDEQCIPDAVLGAEPGHPAVVDMVAKARSVLEGGGDAWHSGPGVCTETLPDRPDVLVLPPGAFYPHHYLEKSKAGDTPGRWVFVRHHWHGSWLTPAQRASQQRRQR